MKKKLRIAVVVPPFSVVPPKGQGGTERVAYQMIEGLSSKGHSLTLFGTGKCKTSAKFVQIFKTPISQMKFNEKFVEGSRTLRLETAYITRVISEIIKREKHFDIVVNHLRGGYLFLPLASFLKIPVISVMHLPLFKELANTLASFKETNIITVSKNQQKGFAKVNFLGFVHNSVDTKKFSFQPKPKDYFLFVGALGEHKNPKDAILACRKAKKNLIIAGGKKREPYFTKEIKPLIDGKQIKYVGEVFGKKKIKLFQEAKGFLLPIKWPEPFGIIMIEAMSCGVPVIAYPNGAAPEVIKNKKTGFLVKNVSQMARAIKNIDKIDRAICRKHVEKNFTTEKMVAKYEKICHNLVR